LIFYVLILGILAVKAKITGVLNWVNDFKKKVKIKPNQKNPKISD